jgi:hypothetical protein
MTAQPIGVPGIQIEDDGQIRPRFTGPEVIHPKIKGMRT